MQLEVMTFFGVIDKHVRHACAKFGGAALPGAMAGGGPLKYFLSASRGFNA